MGYCSLSLIKAAEETGNSKCNDKVNSYLNTLKHVSLPGASNKKHNRLLIYNDFCSLLKKSCNIDDKDNTCWYIITCGDDGSRYYDNKKSDLYVSSKIVSQIIENIKTHLSGKKLYCPHR